MCLELGQMKIVRFAAITLLCSSYYFYQLAVVFSHSFRSWNGFSRQVLGLFGWSIVVSDAYGTMFSLSSIDDDDVGDGIVGRYVRGRSVKPSNNSFVFGSKQKANTSNVVGFTSIEMPAPVMTLRSITFPSNPSVMYFFVFSYSIFERNKYGFILHFLWPHSCRCLSLHPFVWQTMLQYHTRLLIVYIYNRHKQRSIPKLERRHWISKLWQIFDLKKNLHSIVI